MSDTLDFQALFNHSPNPYMVLDRELRYVAANEAYLRLTASRLEELVGRSIFEAFPHDPAEPDNANARMLRTSFERAHAAPARTDGLRILLVEDDEDIRESARELLEVLGHQVRAVASAEAAQEALGTGGFDVLFTDVSLPGRSGVELAREAVRRHPGLRVIIASGHGTSVISSGGEVTGAVLLPKPYALPELKGALARVEASRREADGGSGGR